MNPRLGRLQVHPTVRLEAWRAEIAARGLPLFDFGVGDPADPTPDFVRQALIDAVPEVSDYPTAEGSIALRAAAAGYLARRFGIRLDPERELLPTSGTKEAIFHLALVLFDPTSPRDSILFGDPAYEAFRIGAAFAGAREQAVPLTAARSYLWTPEDVGAAALARAAIVFLNYPHNPTGQDMPGELYRQWVAARDEHGFLLVSDECYCDLYFGEPPRSLLEFGNRGCLAVHSLSKRSGMTGYQSGFLAGDAELIATLRRFRGGMGVASPVWTQAAAAAAWADAEHVEERRGLYAEKRRVLTGILTARGLRLYPGNASLFLWVEVPHGITDVGYAEQLLQRGIVVAPGSMFGAGQERYIRVALAPTLEVCRAVAEVWP